MKRGWCIICSMLLWTGWSQADVFTIDTSVEWGNWRIPQDVVVVNAEGHLELAQYRKDINAVTDARLYVHPTQDRGDVTGGIWRADSGSASAGLLIDGDPETFWRPNPADPLAKWVVEVDLGRAVLARDIRLLFPDEEGARPFRQFSVFVATGARIQAQQDVFRYYPVFQTTRPNKDTEIRIGLADNLDTTRVVGQSLDVDMGREAAYRMVQFIRIRVEDQSADAALAEIEVIGVGDNISLGTLARGGTFTNGLLAPQPQNMFDGIMDTYGNILNGGFSKGGWQEGGLWWQVDLGAQFWVDEIFIYWQERGEGLSSFLYDFFNAGSGYQILVSDGRRTPSGTIDYEFLLLEPRPSNTRGWNLRHFRYLFKPRKIRYLFWHGLTDLDWFSHPMEFMMFSPGHPAQVELRSDFIDLGVLGGDGRAKVIKTLSWDADLPPDTHMQLRSRSGNSLQEEYIFHDRIGAITTEAAWIGKPKVLRGEIDTIIVISDDWGAWSNFYQFSGESFKSESPRRYVELEMILSTDDTATTPLVRSLSIEFEDALVQDARGRILPRRAAPNQDTRFVYTVWPGADEVDSGFDLLRLVDPGPVDTEGVEVRIGGLSVPPTQVSLEGDSLLLIALPNSIKRDSVEISFTTRVLRNAQVFSIDLGSSERPGLWQSVEPTARRADQVFLPDLVGSDALIGDLVIAPAVFTPNGDGINDAVEIRFVVFKVIETQPRVRIFDLAGHQIAILNQPPGGDDQTYTWSGEDENGELVPPGTYLCHIDLEAEAGDRTALRSLAVAY